MMPDCTTCHHLAHCAKLVRARQAIMCELDRLEEQAESQNVNQQVTRRVTAWLKEVKPSAITTTLVAQELGIPKQRAEYALRRLARSGIIAVESRHARRDTVYRMEGICVPG